MRENHSFAHLSSSEERDWLKLFYCHLQQLHIGPFLLWLLSSPLLSSPLLSSPPLVGLQGVSDFFLAAPHHFHVCDCFVFAVRRHSLLFLVSSGSNIPKREAKQHHSSKQRHPKRRTAATPRGGQRRTAPPKAGGGDATPPQKGGERQHHPKGAEEGSTTHQGGGRTA